MSEQFLHGIEVVEITDGTRPISTVKSSVSSEQECRID